MRLCEFQKKEVINACDCKRLGTVTDLIFDECTGQVEALIVPKGGKWNWLTGDGSECIIPFSCIKKIGPDIILVEVREGKNR